MNGVAAFSAGAAWFAGMVLAKGFWSTAAAVIFPPWGWYLVVERGLQVLGWA